MRHIELSTAHFQSRRGVPVLLIDDDVYGPQDETPFGPAEEIAREWAAGNTKRIVLLERFLAAIR